MVRRLHAGSVPQRVRLRTAPYKQQRLSATHFTIACLWYPSLDTLQVPTFLSSIHITTSDAAVEAAANAAAILTSGTIFARDMVNERADEMNPERIEVGGRISFAWSW